MLKLSDSGWLNEFPNDSMAGQTLAINKKTLNNAKELFMDYKEGNSKSGSRWNRVSGPVVMF